MFENLGESIEFAGMAVAHLAQDPKKLDKTGRVLLTCNLATEYGFQDSDGSIHDVLSIKNLLNNYVIICYFLCLIYLFILYLVSISAVCFLHCEPAYHKYDTG